MDNRATAHSAYGDDEGYSFVKWKSKNINQKKKYVYKYLSHQGLLHLLYFYAILCTGQVW